jgi:hypothetical protein
VDFTIQKKGKTKKNPAKKPAFRIFYGNIQKEIMFIMVNNYNMIRIPVYLDDFAKNSREFHAVPSAENWCSLVSTKTQPNNGHCQ